MMKKKYLISIAVLIAFALSYLTSCNVIWDKDVTEEISKTSVKPKITVLGEPMISMKVGGTYEEKGIKVDAGANEYTERIVSGEVNPNVEGFYLVKYEAINEYGWASYAYRSVLVHDGDAFTSDIADTYVAGNQENGVFQFISTIQKHPTLNGYWITNDAWQEDGVTVPLAFAENGDGTYTIVPYEDENKGYIFGTVTKTSSDITYWFEVYPKGGGGPKEFDHTWSKLQ